MRKKPKSQRFMNITVKRAVMLGTILLVLVGALAGHLEMRAINDLATSTAATLRRQCIRFDKLVAADRTKSLFRMTELMRELCLQMEEAPDLTVNDSFLEAYVDDLRLSGVAVLDGDMALEASGYTRRFRDSAWADSLRGSRFSDILEHSQKVYAERIESDGEYYDVCALARKDAPGIIVGFYHQPSGLITGTENDLESLLSGLILDRNGHYVILEDGIVRATSVTELKGVEVENDRNLLALSKIPKDGKLHLLSGSTGPLWGYRAACDGYSLYIYFPLFTSLTSGVAIVILFIAIYLLLCLVYFAVRSQALYQNQEMLRESNRSLTETVQMLKSLETIYFSLFYIDLSKRTFRTIYSVPWLKERIPENGEYARLMRFFLEEMVRPEYRELVKERTDDAFIRQNLGHSHEVDVRKSYYTDYQSNWWNGTRWCRLSITVVDYDEQGYPVHVMALLQDVNKEKTKEAAYQEQILKEARDAKLANEAKTEFLRRISHDIRTPVNGIQGLLDMAGKHPEDMQLQNHCRERVSDAAKTLLSLVNSVLDMSKLEAGEVIMEEIPFDLTELLERLNAVVRPQAEAKNIAYRVERDSGVPVPKLLGSPRYVGQILLNLSGNAVKYGKPGGFVEVNTRLVDRGENTVTYEFTCRDNGIGMSREFQEHLFEPFTQEQNDARTTYQGTGLGLSIVKKLVDALGGTITFQSEQNVGTTFCVRLTFRVDEAYQEKDTAEVKPDACLKGKHVLLVEDNDLNMEISQFLLQEHGAQITPAWNGQEAVEAFESSKPGYFDLILMDIMMPVLNGLEAAKTIRGMNRPDAKTVPIAAMSANTFPDDIQRSLDAGMNGHIAKPVDEEKLLQTIRKMLKS